MKSVLIKCPLCFARTKFGSINNKRVCTKCNSTFTEKECLFRMCSKCDVMKPLKEFDYPRINICFECKGKGR